MYNISSPEDNDITKLVVSVRAGGKPPAGWITNLIFTIFLASYVIYLYNIHWLLHIIACHYRRMFVQCLSLSAYICPMPSKITKNVIISNVFQ